MPETKYERDKVRFDCLGLDLNRPVDSVKPGKFPYLLNLRSIQNGRVEQREGLTSIANVVTGQTPVHSCRRLNDPANSTFTRVLGAGTHLAYGQGSFTDLDSGYSGNPLALVPWRPEASPSPFMYVGDSSRMRKVGAAGALHTVGLAAPSTAPDVVLSPTPSYKVVDDFFATTGWTQGGTAGAPALVNYRTNTTITRIIYDGGSPNWANVVPVSMDGIAPGERLIFAGSETAVVQAVTPGFAATTIARVIYDDNSTGLCAVVLTLPADQVGCDAMISNTTHSSYGRVIAVTAGPAGTISLRVDTGTNGVWVAGDTVQVVPAFRVYLVGSFTTSDTLVSDGVRSIVATGTGTLTRTVSLDLSSIVSGVAAQPEDYMHISVRVSDPTVVTEIKVLLDVDSTTNDFTRNYYWRSFRPSDITLAAANQQSLLQANQSTAQRQVVSTILVSNITQQEAQQLAFEGLIPTTIDVSDPSSWSQELQSQYATEIPVVASSQEMNPGSNQWAEMRFHLSELTRVGTDTSRTLRNVAAIRIVVICTGGVNADVSSWWMGGGYGPDTGDPTASPYYYRYRARNISTNVPSNCSPATRYQAAPLRQRITISPTQYAAPSGTSLTTADFVLDLERFGGLIASWHYVGTIPNSATPSFIDAVADDVVAGNTGLGNANYQPWPVISTPVSGTTGIVAGTTVNDTGTSFNTSWAPGTRIIINSNPYTIYRVISTSRLETVENAGPQNGVTWRIDAPTILAQPLPALWESSNTFFGCGDPTNPGRLYYSNPDSETTTPSNYIDVTSPSEPLMNGVTYNIRPYLFSSENFFQILQTGNPAEPWRYEIIPNGKGLFSRWLLTREPAPVIAFGSRDGIYVTKGGSPTSLTDADLYPLFPNEGLVGEAVNNINPPNIVSAQAANLRLSYYDDFLYFDFVDTASARATLVYCFNLGAVQVGGAPGGWFYDVYSPTSDAGVVFHYGEEGQGVHSLLCGGATTTTGKLYQYTGNSDNSVAISCHLRTGSRDQGDARLNKLYGDIMLDADPASVSLTCTPGVNNYATTYTPLVIASSGRIQTPIPLGSLWRTGRNIALDIAFSNSTVNRPLLYIWEPRWTFEPAPISALAWEIGPTTFGMENFKSFGMCKISYIGSAALSLDITVDGVAQSTITVAYGGSATVYYQIVFRVPVMKGKLYQIRLSCASEFRLDTRDSYFEIKDWASNGAYQKLRVFGDFSLVEG